MKPSFHARPLNGPFEDPGIYVRILRQGRAMMFDLGFTTSLSARDILKTTDFFVSHAHIDHFIGFDPIMRVSLKKDVPLHIYGPVGITDCIEGKLKGYAWNLITNYPVVIQVTEVNGAVLMNTVFRAAHSFAREPVSEAPFTGVLLDNPESRVSAAVLDHQIPCLAFRLDEDYHINIDRSALKEMNLPVGPWLARLKSHIRKNIDDASYEIDGKTRTYAEVSCIAKKTRGQRLCYVTDACGTRQNIDRIIRLCKDADVLFIEAFFLDRDRQRARDRHHLTAAQSGMIAGKAGAGRMELIHFSPRYREIAGELRMEAEEAFKAWKK